MRIRSLLLAFCSVMLLLASCADAPEPAGDQGADSDGSHVDDHEDEDSDDEDTDDEDSDDGHNDDEDSGSSMESEVDAEAFVGLSKADAIEEAEDEDLQWRIGREDDQLYPLTMDFRPDRVTFEIDDGVVTVASAG